MIRNRWLFIYLGFYLLLTFGLLLLSNDLGKVIVSLTSVILVLTPLIGILFGILYYYNSREFIELLLAQPISRKSVFNGVYLGLITSLSISVILGISIPMLIFGILSSPFLSIFFILVIMATVLTITFVGIAFLLGLRFENKIKGFGVAIFTWLFFAVIYDGIFLLLLLLFKDYPLEKLSLALSIFNPIDLARILIVIQLDVSAIMGYTGAVFQKFLGNTTGSLVIFVTLIAWMLIPYLLMKRLARKKDF